MSEPRDKITVRTVVNAPLEKVWSTWTTPADIQEWNAASDDWHTPTATNDLRVGGEFHYHMKAREHAEGFDFWGTYTAVTPQAHIASTLGDGRTVDVTFAESPEGVVVTETFEVENENSGEMQRVGWQAILERFKKHTEGTLTPKG